MQYENKYELDQSNMTIISPGKFEGEPRYAPYFHEWYLHGEGEWLDDDVTMFVILREDKDKFPELENEPYMYLWEDGDGFIKTSTNRP